MLHPSGSPDLNPIEPLWHTLKELIHNWPHIPTTLDKLKITAKEAWEQITEADINKHVNSMEKRVWAVIQAKGSHTCY
jgi:transposase